MCFLSLTTELVRAGRCSQELRRRGLRISGRKAELQGRLFQAICDDDPAMRAA